MYRFSRLVDDARAGLRRMASRPGVDRGRLAVFGFSMGGWTALHLGARVGGLRGVAAVAPVGGPEMVRGGTRLRVRDLGRPLKTGSNAALAADFVRSVRMRDPAESAGRLVAPLLLVHGTSDEVVPIEVSRRIHAAARRPKRLVEVRGARHDFLDRRARLVRVVSDWLVRRLRR